MRVDPSKPARRHLSHALRRAFLSSMIYDVGVGPRPANTLFLQPLRYGPVSKATSPGVNVGRPGFTSHAIGGGAPTIRSTAESPPLPSVSGVDSYSSTSRKQMAFPPAQHGISSPGCTPIGVGTAFMQWWAHSETESPLHRKYDILALSSVISTLIASSPPLSLPWESESSAPLGRAETPSAGWASSSSPGRSSDSFRPRFHGGNSSAPLPRSEVACQHPC